MKLNLLLTVLFGVLLAAGASAEGISEIALVTKINYPDALVMSPVSSTYGIPVLVTDAYTLSSEVTSVLNNEGISSVYLIGGPVVINESIEDQLEDDGYTVTRIWGPTMVGTAIEVALYFWGSSSEVVLYVDHPGAGDHGNYKAALAASSLASSKKIPLLIQTASESSYDAGTVGLSSDVESALEDLGVQKIYLVGLKAEELKRYLESKGYSVEYREDADDVHEDVKDESTQDTSGETDEDRKRRLEEKILVICVENFNDLIRPMSDDHVVIIPVIGDEDIQKVIEIALDIPGGIRSDRIRVVGEPECVAKVKKALGDNGITPETPPEKDPEDNAQDMLEDWKNRWIQKRAEGAVRFAQRDPCEKLAEIISTLETALEHIKALIESLEAGDSAGEPVPPEVLAKLWDLYDKAVRYLSTAQLAYEDNDCDLARELIFRVRDKIGRMKFIIGHYLWDVWMGEVDKEWVGKEDLENEANNELPDLEDLLRRLKAELDQSGRCSQLLYQRAVELLKKAQLVTNKEDVIELIRAAKELLERARRADCDVTGQTGRPDEPEGYASGLLEKLRLCPDVYEPVCARLPVRTFVSASTNTAVAIDVGAEGNYVLRTYPNKCLAEAEGAEVVHYGECQEGGQVVCPEIFSPVCGVDGNTYPNRCVAHAKGVEVAYEGRCQASGRIDPVCAEQVKEEMYKGARLRCAEKCSVTTGTADPACKEKAETSCVQECAVKAERTCTVECTGTASDATGAAGQVNQECYSTCKAKVIESCKPSCIRERLSQCTVTTTSEDSDCVAQCIREIIPENLEDLIIAKCTIEPVACTLEYSPVCGADGKTYGNECSARAAGVKILYPGECKQETGLDPDCAARASYQCLANVKETCFGKCSNTLPQECYDIAREKCQYRCDADVKTKCQIECRITDENRQTAGVATTIQTTVVKEFDKSSPLLATTSGGGGQYTTESFFDVFVDVDIPDYDPFGETGTGYTGTAQQCLESCISQLREPCIKECGMQIIGDCGQRVGDTCTTNCISDLASTCRERVLQECKYGDVCTDVYDPVCAVTATGEYKTYGNACRAQKAQAKVVHRGQCEVEARGFIECTPNMAGQLCTFEYDPVCAVVSIIGDSGTVAGSTASAPTVTTATASGMTTTSVTSTTAEGVFSPGGWGYETRRTHPNACVACSSSTRTELVKGYYPGACEVVKPVEPKPLEPGVTTDCVQQLASSCADELYKNCRYQCADVTTANIDPQRCIESCAADGKERCWEKARIQCAGVVQTQVECPVQTPVCGFLEITVSTETIGGDEPWENPVTGTYTTTSGVYRTFKNPCEARAAGAKVVHEGPCTDDDTGTGEVPTTECTVDEAGNVQCATTEGGGAGGTTGTTEGYRAYIVTLSSMDDQCLDPTGAYQDWADSTQECYGGVSYTAVTDASGLAKFEYLHPAWWSILVSNYDGSGAGGIYVKAENTAGSVIMSGNLDSSGMGTFEMTLGEALYVYVG